MASKSLRPCRHPGCAALTREGWCPAHKPKPAARRESAAWHNWYNLPVWKNDLRPAQLFRESFCRECARTRRPRRAGAPLKRCRSTILWGMVMVTAVPSP